MRKFTRDDAPVLVIFVALFVAGATVVALNGGCP